jgi:hypothetical protein
LADAALYEPSTHQWTPTVPGKGSMTLQFTGPAAAGGLDSVVYSASCSPVGGGTPITAQGSVSPLKVTGLTVNTSYICTLRASNSAGTSSAAQATATVRNLDLTPILMLLLD